MKKLIKTYLNTETVFIIAVAIFEIFHVQRLFGGAELLAGGDNYIFLQLGKINLYPYIWDLKFTSFGGINVSLPNLLGIPLYSYILKYFSFPIMERVLIYFLYLFRYVAFIKLIKFLSKKISYFSLIPALFLFSFNAFEALNPFSLYPLMYSVYLPFSLYFFIKLFSSNKFDFSNIFKLIILSVIFSPINSNIALGITVFIPQFLYFVYNFRSINKHKLVNIGLYLLLMMLTSLWWILPLTFYFFNSAKEIFSANWFSATGIGDLGSNFRFIGQWGWYGGHFLYNYYPFNQYYDSFIVVLITYTIIVFAFLGNNIGNVGESKFRKIRAFFIFLSIFGLFLINGSGAPFGLIYNFLYNNAFGFKIFREPFTKFGEIYVLSVCILFYFSLEHLRSTLLKKLSYRILAFVLILLSVFIAVKPSLLGDHVWSKWNGSMRTFRVNVPDYWNEFENYVKLNINDSRILTTPKIFYGAAWNWPNGISSADDIAINFIGNSNNLLRNPLSSAGGKSGAVLDNFFNNISLNPNYLGLLGADYVLQENDFDWRYSPVPIYSPDKNTLFMRNLELLKVAEFGKFTNEYMSKIVNEDPDTLVRNDMYATLLNKPALILYRPGIDKTLPKIYIPKRVVYSTGKIQDLPSIVDSEDKDSGDEIRGAYFLDVYKSDVNKFANSDILSQSDSVVIFPRKLTTKMDPNTFIWNIGWSWPDINVNPKSLEYKLVIFQERIDLISLFDNMKKLDLLAWNSAKRAEEIRKYSLNDGDKLRLISNLLDNVNKGIDIIEKTPESKRDDRYWEVVTKFNSYVERAFGTLSEFNIDLAKDTKILDAMSRFKAAILKMNDITCGELCYKFQVPENGTYSLFIEGNLIEELYLKKNNPIQRNLNPSLYTKSLEIGEIKNFGETGKFAQIKGWEEDKQYKISFDYETNSGKLGFVLIEEIKKKIDSRKIERKSLIKELPNTFSTDIKNQEIIQNTKYCTFIENSLCYTHYEKIVKSSKKVGNALFLFELNSGDFPIKNFRIKNVSLPDVRLVKKTLRNVNGNVNSIPKIEFTRINPTRYVIHVSNAKSPYFLVFNDTFNIGWKLYRTDKDILKIKEYLILGWVGDIFRNLLKGYDTLPVKTATKYFNGDILENKERYTFLNSSTFKTWGRKDIVPKKHYIANGYANSWLISPEDVSGKSDYTLILDFWLQRVLILFFMVFVAVMGVGSLYIIHLRFRRHD